MLNEDTLIKMLLSRSQGFLGDDAAVLPLSKRAHYVVTNDLLIEDIHFRTAYFKPENLAHKALQVNLSDLAAMGAKPLYILCGLSIPLSLSTYAKSFLQYLIRACKKSNVILIGGDTTRSPDKLYISITALGASPIQRIKYRNKAQEGDIICLAGNIGWAHLGLTALEKSLPVAKTYKKAFLQPQAKIKESLWLARQPSVTAMIDISDGLYIDLKRLCKASALASIIDLEKLAPDNHFINACKSLALEPLNVMLTGGEDYGLLFTVQPEAWDRLADVFFDCFKYAIKPLGHLIKGTSVHIRKNNVFINWPVQPFTHFGENL